MIQRITQSFIPSSPAAVSPPAAEQPYHFQQCPPIVSPDERLCAALAEGPALGEYSEAMDTNNTTDELSFLNQLFEIPALRDIINEWDASFPSTAGFEQALDSNFNLNFNQNLAHYNDVQFNMLVNENQTPQSEPQENPGAVVHIKTEEAL